MKRKMTRVLEQWKDDTDKVALVIAGSRRIGKTHVIEEFCRERYGSYLRLDLSEKRARDIFRDSIRASKILDGISLGYPEFRLIEGDTVLFLDGIHLCRNAWYALKPLVWDGSVDVVAADSLMYVKEEDETRHVSPMGYEIVYRMYPMDFEEYLWAVGLSEDDTAGIRRRFRDCEPFDEDTLKALMEQHARYMETGGLPAVVEASLSDRDRVERLQRDLLTEYRRDILEYAPSSMRDRALACSDSMPEMLGRRGKKFLFSKAESRTGNRGSAGRREYGMPVEWIVESGLAVLCRNISERDRLMIPWLKRPFKLYCFDTGILGAMFAADPGFDGNDQGAMAENYVADMIASYGYGLNYLERDDAKGRIEIDFVVNIGGEWTAIQVMSGKRRRSGSLKKLRTDPIYAGYKVKRFIKFENGNVFTDELGVEHYPIFAAAFMDELDRSPELPESFEPLPLNL